jgi:glutathione-regulated potassium-efflux system ancillary protein KefC
MDTILIVTIAFAFGFTVKQIGLPPLVGFLAAGFFLNFMGVEPGETLGQLADIGIILLLFSIGLKVQVKKLFVPKIWGTASIHMLVTTVFFGLVIFSLSALGMSYFTGLDLSSSLVIAFALSFSSTVFAVKILEEKSEMSSRHGRLAISILIMQDFFAVIFITISSGNVPSPLAFGLFGLYLLRKPLMGIMDRSGHGELLVLLACILPLAGANLFEHVGLKADLGALVLGMLLAGHPKTDELAKAMLGFKDLFLVGFFLTIGLSEMPDLAMFGVAGLLVLFIPLKALLFFFLLTRFRLRARISLLSSISLANYSEFGLIVGAVGVKNGWLGGEWLVIIAVALSLSMIIASPLIRLTSDLYNYWKTVLIKFETTDRLPGDREIDFDGATVIVFGMGRVGTGAYEHIQNHYGRKVIGVDFDEELTETHRLAGRNVVCGDGGNDEFWQRGIVDSERPRLVLLNMSHEANLYAVRRIRQLSSGEIVAATAEHEDQVKPLLEAGINHVFNIYSEAGAGFSEHVCEILSEQEKTF